MPFSTGNSPIVSNVLYKSILIGVICIIVDYVSMGRIIASRRIALGLTQEELAEHCNLSAGYIGCIERADRIISLNSLILICCALNISPNDLLRDSLPDTLFMDHLDTPLKLREPDLTLRNTLSNWYLADQPDESQLSDVPVTSSQLSKLEFMFLDQEFPFEPIKN